MYYLMKHPDVYTEFKREIRAHFQRYEDITSSLVGTLPYFHAVINETMRLYPPVPFGPPRLSPGAYVDGTYIPKGVSQPLLCFLRFLHLTRSDPSLWK